MHAPQALTRRRDAWDTGVVSNIDGEMVRFFHTRDKGVDRVWVDHECFLAKVCASLCCMQSSHCMRVRICCVAPRCAQRLGKAPCMPSLLRLNHDL